MNQMSVFKNASFQLTRSSQALALMQALFPSTSTSPRPFPQTLCSAAPLLLSNFISETTTNSICSNGCVMLSAFQEDSEQLDNSSRVADAIESNPPPAEGAFMSIWKPENQDITANHLHFSESAAGLPEFIRSDLPESGAASSSVVNGCWSHVLLLEMPVMKCEQKGSRHTQQLGFQQVCRDTFWTKCPYCFDEPNDCIVAGCCAQQTNNARIFAFTVTAFLLLLLLPTDFSIAFVMRAFQNLLQDDPIAQAKLLASTHSQVAFYCGVTSVPNRGSDINV
jgi:hypothetical protein